MITAKIGRVQFFLSSKSKHYNLKLHFAMVITSEKFNCLSIVRNMLRYFIKLFFI